MEKTHAQPTPKKAESHRKTQATTKHAGERSNKFNRIPDPLNSEPFSFSPSLDPNRLLYLQSTIGNRAVGRFIQSKLAMSRTDDQYKRGADGVAETVMRMPEPEAPEEEVVAAKLDSGTELQRQVEEEQGLQAKRLPGQSTRLMPKPVRLPTHSAIPQIQTVSAGGVAQMQRQPESEVQRIPTQPLVNRRLSVTESSIQTKGVRGPTPQVSPVTAAKLRSLNGGGSQLPRSARSFFEPVENRTGMPDRLKAGLEQLGGLDLSGVRVHYNSAKPAQLKALAYAQGQDIHLGPRQEKHLPHEGWHAVQQMQGRVKPTRQLKDGVPVNDDRGLEHEADVMGAKAQQMRHPDFGATGWAAQAEMAEQREVEPTEASEVPREGIGASGEKGCLNFLSTDNYALQQYKKGTDSIIQRWEAKDFTNQISQEISSSHPARSAHKAIVGAIFDKLDSKNISYKVGGSIAAKLLGARRSPNDLEMEMPSMQSVEDGHGAVNEVATTYQIPTPYTIIGNPPFGVNIQFDKAILNNRTGKEEPVRFEIDMMNENSEEMNQQLEKPQVMDIFSGNASREIDKVVTRSRLIVNYADRSYNKMDTARLKQDYHQIHDLLENANKDAVLREASHHGHARTNFNLANIIRGQNKVSEFVASAEQSRWMENGQVKPNAGKAHLNIAKDKGWLRDNNTINTRYELPAWQP